MKKPSWNELLLPKDSPASQLVPELSPHPGEIVVTKTTDSALTGTNLRLILANMGIRNVVLTGIFTDQCVSSTVRSLADESFNVIVIEDCCAAGTDELHRRESKIINMIYCHVVPSRELRDIMVLIRRIRACRLPRSEADSGICAVNKPEKQRVPHAESIPSLPTRWAVPCRADRFPETSSTAHARRPSPHRRPPSIRAKSARPRPMP
jgi:hypothetical protein